MPPSVHVRRICTPLLALLLAVAGCAAPPPEPPSPAKAPAAASPSMSAPSQRAIDAVRPLVGVALVVHHISDLELYLGAVDDIARLGANALSIVTPMFMDNIHASTIDRPADRCPTTAQLDAIIARAEQRGLHTMLVPIVLLEHAGEKQWRGVIEPDDWTAWWTSYTAHIDTFIDMAARHHVDLFCIGSELNSTEDQLDRWQALAESVRSRFDGQITYAANWDRYDRIELWPIVDIMSVSSYFEIGRRVDGDAAPDANNLAAAWLPDQQRLLDAARRFDRPLLLSEVGYPSLPWAARFPWNYVANGEPADHDAQATCYTAFFDAWIPHLADPDSPAVGFHLYAWDPYHHGQPTDTGYGFRGKPAADVIAVGIRAVRAAAARQSMDPADH